MAGNILDAPLLPPPDPTAASRRMSDPFCPLPPPHASSMLRRDASFQPFAHFFFSSASFHISYYAIPYARRQLFVGIPVLGKGKGALALS